MGAPTATWKGVLLGIIAARLHALWVLLTTTGLRLGEARGLQWSDIDFANGRLVVNRALQRQTGSGYVFVEPKTARSRRTIYLAPGALSALTDHRRRQVQDQLAAGPDWNSTGLIFRTAVGQPADGTWVTKWFIERSIWQAYQSSGSTTSGTPQRLTCCAGAFIPRWFRSCWPQHDFPDP